MALIIAYVSYALLNSRTGRSWIAMREDETVADAMGVNTVAAKLSAFAIGALFASFAGALFATKIHSVVPASFTVDESILVLIIVIVGGMASVPGVAVGALALVGLPEVLREFEEYRFLVYGALLIFMMLKRPAGLDPQPAARGRAQEDEQSQDAWLKESEPHGRCGRRRGRPDMPLLEITGPDEGVRRCPRHRRVELLVERGEIVSVIGPNGAGKTTLLQPHHGHVSSPTTGRSSWTARTSWASTRTGSSRAAWPGRSRPSGCSRR